MTARSDNIYMSFAVMEDSAMLGSNTSAMTDFGEAVFPHCLFSCGISASRKHNALNPGVRGWPRLLMQKLMPTLHIKLSCLIQSAELASDNSTGALVHTAKPSQII